MNDVEPKVLRHRLIVEGLLEHLIHRPKIDEYLMGLSKVSGMRVLMPPIGYDNHPGNGSATWIHWDSSGAHFYVYAASPHAKYMESLEHPLFTLDTYTCKPFSIDEVVEFTIKTLDPLKMNWEEVGIGVRGKCGSYLRQA